MEKTFFSRLTKLFSTAVIINEPGKKRKVLDIDKLQAYSNYETNRVVDKYTGVKKGFSDYLRYNQTVGYEVNKNELYGEYERMDADPILSSALDIYSDDSTVKNKYSDIMDISSPNEKVQESLTNLFYDILNIEFNLWTWIRSLCKYGDFYVKLDITEKIGVTNAYPMSPYAMGREEDPDNPMLVRFRYDANSGQSISHRTYTRGDSYYFENYEIAHFRLISDTNYLPYGRSILEPARKVWKQLILMEDAMLIHRIMRAPEKRVFKIDIGNIPPDEVDTHMNNIIAKLKKVPYMDQETGQYNLEFNLMNMLEDFYLPVRGDRSGTEIDTLSGMEFTGIEDIEYLRNKMMAALKIPKAFLTYEEEINAKATLSMEDARFARTIERVQKIVVSELTKIAIVHLYSQGYKNEDLVNFSLTLTIPSTAIEREKIEVWSEQVSLARDMKDLKLLSNEYIYENIFNLSKEQWEEEEAKLVNNLKLAFRYQQIEDEGNDPAKTKETVGTESDNQFEQDSFKKDSGNLNSLQDKKETKKAFTSEVDFANNSFINSLKEKKKKLISETFNVNKIEHKDEGTFLDEKGIITESKDKKKRSE